MRYPDGGGLTPAARARREQIRLEAAGLFAAGMSPPLVAKKLRVSRKSAYAWHKIWRTAGAEALASKGPGGQHSAVSNATSPARSIRSSRRQPALDIHRGIKLAVRFEATVTIAAINQWLRDL
ncbi:helix-turn-helix domain-containing protein [Nonomuraea sp. NPDC050540]|uniref:helix-turn-helix domain-containing protein n=1 Tax=Nonomuraea sp. NPDC050540 TaxID=3364367 RepID=UPI00378F9C05